ncbi:beta-ketoacyl synthase chain length factor [Salegentibacter sp. HM20]
MGSKIYINGIASISSQPADATEEKDFMVYHQNIIPALDPDYKQFIKPMALRRMSKAVKMGISASRMALSDAGVEMPSAIITGTGQGCKQDTEKFLQEMLEREEELLSPTAFIQSTHNTVGGQIALHLKCKKHNLSYSQNSGSLESAILEAQLIFAENDEPQSVLVGGVEEISEKITGFMKLDGQIKQDRIKNFDLLQNQTSGTIVSEGAHFFVLGSTANPGSYAELLDSQLHLTVKNIDQTIEKFLSKNQMKLEDIDLLMLGKNGDANYDFYYDDLISDRFKNTTCLAWKPLCGEYDTVSGYAVFQACRILKTGVIPEVFRVNSVEPGKIKNILIYNQYLAKNHGLILLRAI